MSEATGESESTCPNHVCMYTKTVRPTTTIKHPAANAFNIRGNDGHNR